MQTPYTIHDDFAYLYSKLNTNDDAGGTESAIKIATSALCLETKVSKGASARGYARSH
jgi:hypothetical protein